MNKLDYLIETATERQNQYAINSAHNKTITYCLSSWFLREI